ncbi:uncharacterized protein [Pleurodeles waltl]
MTLTRQNHNRAEQRRRCRNQEDKEGSSTLTFPTPGGTSRRRRGAQTGHALGRAWPSQVRSDNRTGSLKSGSVGGTGPSRPPVAGPVISEVFRSKGSASGAAVNARTLTNELAPTGKKRGTTEVGPAGAGEALTNRANAECSAHRTTSATSGAGSSCTAGADATGGETASGMGCAGRPRSRQKIAACVRQQRLENIQAEYRQLVVLEQEEAEIAASDHRPSSAARKPQPLHHWHCCCQLSGSLTALAAAPPTLKGHCSTVSCSGWTG